MSKDPDPGAPDAATDPPLRLRAFPPLSRPRTNGEIVAFVTAYFAPVSKRFFLLTRDDAMAEELTQNLFLVLLDKTLPKTAPGADMRKVIDELCRVVLRSHLRRLVVLRAREVPADMMFEGNHGATSSSDLAADRDLLRVAKGVLDRMREGMGMAVLMRHCLEMTIPEIAEDLKKPEGTIKTWVRQGTTALAKALDLALDERGEEPALPQQARELLAAAAQSAPRTLKQKRKQIAALIVFLAPFLPRTWLRLKIGAAVAAAAVAAAVTTALVQSAATPPARERPAPHAPPPVTARSPPFPNSFAAPASRP